MLEFHYSCGIIPFYKDKNWTLKVLVLRGRHNHWWFPKGHIETWENCKTTALREFEEETWIPADYINVFSDFQISDEYWFVLNWKKVHKKVDYFSGFPFDPTEEPVNPCGYNRERFASSLIEFSKYFSMNEFLIANELWDFLSGKEKTMYQLLEIINAIATPEFKEKFEFINRFTDTF